MAITKIEIEIEPSDVVALVKTLNSKNAVIQQGMSEDEKKLYADRLNNLSDQIFTNLDAEAIRAEYIASTKVEVVSQTKPGKSLSEQNPQQ